MRCQRALPRTSGFLSRASCTRFSPTCVTPASIASLTRSAGNVFDTATSVTSLRSRPARWHAAEMRASTAARFSAIDTPPLHPPPVRPIDGEIREAIRFLVARAQRVADREARKLARDSPRLRVKRNQIRVLHFELSEHLIHQQQRIGNDLHLARAFFARHRQRFEQPSVLRDVVRGGAKKATNLDDFA